jgi:hypothetical protein
MNPLKERTALTTKAITTLLASVLVASFAGTMLSMPQMIQSVNAQSEQGSENACKGRGELENGRCTEPATVTRTVTCKEVFGQTPTPTAEDKCVATTSVAANQVNTAKETCTNAGGTPETPTTPGPLKRVVCTYDATVTTKVTCPNDITPTPGPNPECLTKPGNRT